jgi:phosphatidate cytidylyltransferase
VTEGEAAPAAPAEPGAGNLLTRVLAALVLAPLTVAIAYAGGWSWTALVTLTTIGLYIEWLTIVGTARHLPLAILGAVALAVAGLCLASGRIEISLFALALGFAGVAGLSPQPRRWSATGFLYATAA